MPKYFKLTVKELEQKPVESVVPMNNAQDANVLANIILNLRSEETEPVITLEYVTQDEVIKLNEKRNKTKDDVQKVTDEFGNEAVVNPAPTTVDAARVVSTTESFGREDAEGNPTGTELSAKEEARKEANAKKQRQAKSANQGKQGE